LQRQLAAAQQITHIGSWEWVVGSELVTWSDELYRIYGLAPQSCEITFARFLSMLHEADRDRVQGQVSRAIEGGGSFAWPERIVRPDGSVRDLDTVGEVITDEHGRVSALIGTCRDVTLERRRDALQSAEQHVLEMIASGQALTRILTAIVELLQTQAPDSIGSILLLDETGKRVRHGAAPHLPEAYNRAIDGAPIGPSAGSCGTAMYLRRPVIVTDIEIDPLWNDYRELARQHGLRACWSAPICASDGHVLGTFALYYRAPRGPGESELRLIERATYLAGIAIQRQQLDQQMRALLAHIESVREEERTAIAREIHDELGQALTALKMDVSWIGRRLAGRQDGGDALREKLDDMSGMIDETIDRVRRISRDLRPGVLDDLGLLAAIEWQAQEVERRTGMSLAVESNLGDVRLPRDLATAVFRILQEALTNVCRHAEASRVVVRLSELDGRLRLQVDDDGKGISPQALASPKSLGLLGMHERVRRLGGWLHVGGEPGRGTQLIVDVPCGAGAGP
jgi:PAS domain S-box-containing protein